MMISRSPLPSVLVMGGGLAGIAAAMALARAGLAVTLVETRKRLGGRATSFVDPTTSELVDNCQHVLMGCCTNLRALYDQLGVGGLIQWHRRLYFAGSDVLGRSVIDTLEADDLPPPLHLTAALMRFRTLSLSEKVLIARGMFSMIRSKPADRAAWHGRTFAQWLRAHGQPPGAVDKFWSVVIVSALNELPERVAADMAIQVFQEGFLANDESYVMGLSSVPLVQLYDAAERVIGDAGGRLLLSASAEQLHGDGQRIAALDLSDGRRLEADLFVSALPFDRLARICSPALTAIDPRLDVLDQFQVSPILGIHLWYDASADQPVMDLPHLILTGSPLQWLFNKGGERIEAGGSSAEESGISISDGHALPGSSLDSQVPSLTTQHLHGVISAAHDLVDRPADDLVVMADHEVRRVLPGAAHARLRHARVIKERRATFSAAPGVDNIRPLARGSIPNLFLAGDWCQSGWPATMEGAVRSGYEAAAAVLAETQKGGYEQVTDLPPSRLYRFLAGMGGSHSSRS